MNDWRKMTAADLGRSIGTGAIDPVALTQSFLDAIEAHPDGARIYARTTPDRALAEARAAGDRAASGTRRSLLDGVPISWKDLFDTAGTATEAGSALLRGRVPARDAVVLRNAGAAGLVCLGKTHMSELAFSGLGLNPVTGTPPSSTVRGGVPGGSSSGAGASVAFGLAAAAIGSDTAGSVRVPAAWNDLVGLKTSHGAISLEGVVPLCPRFDTVGPLTRSVEDAALLSSILSGKKALAPGSSSLEGARLLVPEGPAMDDLDPQPDSAFQNAVARLQAAGAVVERRRVAAIDAVLPLAAVVFAAEAYGVWKEVIEADPDKMFTQILTRFRGGAEVSAADYVAAWRRLDDLRVAYIADVGAFDAVILPTAPLLPPQADLLLADEAAYTAANLRTLRNTRIGSLLDLPGLTLPTGLPGTGLLMQVPAGGDARLLRLGMAAERALA